MPAGVTIYFVRHGETDWNATRRYQGQADIPLNDKGREQAARNGFALRALLPAVAGFDFVASPLGRTIETMRILRGALGMAADGFATDERLIELNYGHWQGQLLADLPHLDPAGVAGRAADPFNWRPRGGENYADLAGRLSGWLSTVERDCVVVSHGGVSRALRWLLVGVDEAEIQSLPVPQDRVLVIRGEAAEWL
ncbi:MAG: histidine phosphatase family protein [Hyphomicrobiaceae bacterium]|nr:histidine phosphatase family protein [Hyphomicrobiaceae bacterium]